jgi:hypothetical protein
MLTNWSIAAVSVFPPVRGKADIPMIRKNRAAAPQAMGLLVAVADVVVGRALSSSSSPEGARVTLS